MATTAKAPWEQFSAASASQSAASASQSTGASAPWEAFQETTQKVAPWEVEYDDPRNDMRAGRGTNRASETPQQTTRKEPTTRLGRAARAVDNTVRGVADILTFGFADEIAAKADQLTGIDSSGRGLSSDAGYQERLDAQRMTDQEGGTARLVGQVGASVLPLGRAATIVNTANKANTARNVAGAGAVVGGTYGFGSGEGDVGDRLVEGAKGAAIGAGGGVVLQQGFRAGSKLLPGKTVTPLSAQNLDDFAVSQQAGKAPNVSVKISPRVAVQSEGLADVVASVNRSNSTGRWSDYLDAHMQLDNLHLYSTTPAVKKEAAGQLQEWNERLLQQASRNTPEGKAAKETIDHLKSNVFLEALPRTGVDDLAIINRAFPGRDPQRFAASRGMTVQELAEDAITANPRIGQEIGTIKLDTKELVPALRQIMDSPNFALFSPAEQKRIQKMMKMTPSALEKFVDMTFNKLPIAKGLVGAERADSIKNWLLNSPMGQKLTGYAGSPLGVALHFIVSPWTGGAQAALQAKAAVERNLAQRRLPRMAQEMTQRPSIDPTSARGIFSDAGGPPMAAQAAPLTYGMFQQEAE
jgi:hypothetical protein